MDKFELVDKCKEAEHVLPLVILLLRTMEPGAGGMGWPCAGAGAGSRRKKLSAGRSLYAVLQILS